MCFPGEAMFAFNGMGSINIPTEDLLRHKVRIDTDNF